jgi:cytidylate kinase
MVTIPSGGTHMPVITISRQFGAGGLTLSKRLSDILGYTLFDQEIIAMVSEKAKVSKNWVQSVEKEAGGKLQQAVSRLMPKNVVDRVLKNEHGYIDEEIYLDHLQNIIRQIASKGNCIILGRGGQYILKDTKDAVHILLIADKEYRIRFMEAKYKLRRTRAEQVVDAEDKRRTNLYRKFNKTDYDHPSHYHLTLNMSKLSIDKASDIVCRLAGTA